MKVRVTLDLEIDEGLTEQEKDTIATGIELTIEQLEGVVDCAVEDWEDA